LFTGHWFPLEQELVRRLLSLNAFIGCSRPGHAGSGQFLICRSCGNAAELNDGGVERAISRSAASQGFAVHGHTVEISGVCPECR
jgi:Fur family zinc uptake transcriptional regulator